VPDALVVADATGVFVMVNGAAEVLFGYTQEELLGMSIEELMPERFKARHVQHRQHFLSHPRTRAIGERLEMPLICQRKDGSEFQAEISLGPFESEQGIYITCAIRDITIRALENQKLRQLLDSSADAMIVVDAKGEMVLVNAQTEALFGYARDALLGNSVDMLLPDRFRSAHSTHRDSFFANPRVRPMGQDRAALYARKKSGEEFQVEISLSPVQTANGLLMSSAIRDITSHVEAERELEAAKEIAERASTSKSRFLAATSHDLRQPLQSLGLYLSAMSGLSDGVQQQQILGNMRQTLNSMAELISALLDISRFEGGMVVADRRDFHLHEIIVPIITANIQQAQKKGLVLENTGTDCVIHSDPSLLKRIIENFVANAVRYTEHGRIIIDCQCDNDIAHISISDTGIGIPEEALNKIFQEHYQLKNELRQQRQGLGLGLFIVDLVADILKHPLHVSSVLGEGSTFALDVPLGTSEPARQSSTTRSYPRADGSRIPTILFVDDDPAIVDAATMLLESFGATVHGAMDGDDAIAHLQAGVYPDLVISDYRLPKYNGIEVVRRIRQAMLKDLPAVIMTGDTSTQEIEAANLKNCTVLHKPVDSDQLISIMNSVTV
tara:strand:+ start:99156 stop:100991 length:1836 start_codon:yes stop_codon:yes gene_type:complete